MRRPRLHLLFPLLTAVVLGIPAAATGQSKATVIQNATIFTVSGATIEKGAVLIRDGKNAGHHRLPFPCGHGRQEQ
jgi:hypothetical protein